MENEAACRRYLALAEEAGDELGAGWAQAELARIVFHEGRDQETQELADAAIRRLEPSGDSRELAFALNVAGWYRWRRGRYEEAEPLLRRAVEIAGGSGRDGELAEATMDLAITLGYLGRAEVAVDTIEEAYAIAMEVGAPSGLGRIYNNYASIAGTADSRASDRGAPRGLGGDEEGGRRQYVAWITGSLGDFEYQLGHLAESETLELESIELARAIGDDPLLGMRIVALGGRSPFAAASTRRRRRTTRPHASSPRTPSPRSRSTGTCSRRRSPGLGATERESWSGCGP